MTSIASEDHLTKISNHLNTCKVFNYLILYPENENVLIGIDNHSKSLSITEKLNETDPLTLVKLFPDKTVNRVYNILAVNSYPISFNKYSSIKSAYFHHLNTLADVQNSTLNFAVLRNANKNFTRTMEIYNELKRAQRYDLDLVQVQVDEFKSKLTTYQEEAFCVIVPMRKHLSALQSAFLDYSFPLSMWLLWLLSIAVGSVIWKLLNKFKSDSHWRFASAVLAMMIGQSIVVRTNRRILTITLQIFLLSTFYIKNVYEGVVTSTMVDSIDNMKFNTFDELLESDKKYMYNMVPKFHTWMRTLSNYEKVRERVSTEPKYDPFPKLASQKFVLIDTCSNIKHKMRLKRTDPVSSYYYLLPQKLLVHYHGLDVGLANPYLERWQTIIDRAHETGLIKAWERFFGVLEMLKRIQGKTHIEKFRVLVVEDILPVIIKITIFYSLAFLIFLCEIFYKEFLSKLSWKLLLRKRRKIRVRRIQVKPMAVQSQ